MNPISHAYYALFHSIFDKQDSAALCHEINRLCQTDYLDFRQVFAQEIQFLKKITDYQLAYCGDVDYSEVALNAVYKKIKNKRLLGELFLPACLCTDMPQKTKGVLLLYRPWTTEYFEYLFKLSEQERVEERAKYRQNIETTSEAEFVKIMDAYKCLCLLVGIRLIYQDEHAAARAFCDEVRLFSLGTGKRNQNYELYHALDFPDFSSLLDSLQMGRHSFQQYNPEDKLPVYAHVFGRLDAETPNYPENECYVTNVRQKSNTAVKRYAQTLINRVDDQRSDFALENNIAGLDDDLSKSEGKYHFQIDKVAKNQRKSPFEQLLSSREKQKALQTRRKRLPCDAALVELHTVKTLFAYFDSLALNGQQRAVVSLLMLSVCLGKSLYELPKLVFRFEEGYYAVEYYLDLPQPEELPPVRYAIEHANEYAFRLPTALNQAVELVGRMDKSLLAEADALLAAFRKRHYSYVSLSNLGYVFESYLISTGVSKVLISLLSDPRPKHHTALYYTEVSLAQLQILHAEFLAQMGERVFNQPLAQAAYYLENENCFVGSKVVLPSETIQEVFANVSDGIKACQHKFHLHDRQFHNAYTLYTYLIVTMCNGHRPVNDTLGNIIDNDILTGMSFISDKEKANKVEGRINYLANIAKVQIKHYLAFCEFRYHMYKQKAPLLAIRYQQVTTGEQAMIFFRDAKDRIAPCIPKNIKPQLSAYAHGFPLNFHRHYMRTALMATGFTDVEINAWMGHDDKEGDIPLSKYSRVSTETLRQIADFIDAHLLKLNIHPIAHD